MTSYNKEQYIAERPSPHDWVGHSNYQILQHYKHLITSRNVLDIGCNHGAVTKLITTLDPTSVTGVDINENALYKARTEYIEDKFANVEFIQWDAASDQEFPIKDAKYDVICTFHTLEHIWPDHLAQFVKNVINLLAVNGALIVVVPFETSYNDPTHVSFFNHATLATLIQNNENMTTIEILDPMRWNDPNILVGLFKRIA